MKKIITTARNNTWNKWMFWIGDFCQIYRNPKEHFGFGYCDSYKEYGILEDGTFIKSFCFNHIIICWCGGKKYREKYNIPRDNWDE